MSSLFLNTNEDTFSIHPVVVLSILDSFKRRDDHEARVMGALLGYRDGNNVSIQESFVVPHNIDDANLNVNFEYFESVRVLHVQANPRLELVGWYFTSWTNSQSDSSVAVAIHHQIVERYGCQNPLLVTVDTLLTNNRLDIQGTLIKKICNAVGEPIGLRFDAVKVETRTKVCDRIAIDAIINNNSNRSSFADPVPTLSYEKSIAGSLTRFEQILGAVASYIQQVNDKTIPADDAVGRKLFEAISEIPTLDKETYNSMFSSNMDDMTLVSDLANLARAQLAKVLE